MPSKNRKKQKHNNIALGILFSVIIIFLIAISFLGKAFSEFQKGKYDNSYPFSIRVENNNGFQFVYIHPDENKISLLDVEKSDDLDIAQLPQDIKTATDNPLAPKDLTNFFGDLNDKDIKTNLTTIDVARIFLLSKSIKEEDIKTYKISSLSDLSSDKIISEIFSDPKIVSEDLRIEVVNATGVYGVGNEVARLLTNLGANVIFVKTANEINDVSNIYYANSKKYTLLRFEKLLGFPSLKTEGKSISDIQIVIGKDAKQFLNN